MMISKFKQLENNITPRNSTAEYCIVHYTNNYDAGSNAEMHYKYFNSVREEGSSADFVVDENTAFQMNDYRKYYTWHTYTNREKSIGNYNSASVETCVNSDGDLHKALLNTAIVVADICIDLDIPMSRVLRHYDVTKKICPAYFVDLTIKEIDPRWIYFKSQVEKIILSKTMTFDKALEVLTDALVINSPEYWRRYAFPWKETLFINMANHIVLSKGAIKHE